MEKELRVVPVAPAAAANLWPHIEGYIARALKRGGLERAYLPTDILAHILKERMFLWVATDGQTIDAAIITKLNVYDRCTTCDMFLVGGRNLSQWFAQAQSTIEEWARKIGCPLAEARGRRGWLRLNGYREAGYIYVKEL